MSVQHIVQLKTPQDRSWDAILREAMPAVVAFGAPAAAIVGDLVDTMNHHPIAIGLAAPQIGARARVAVINISQARTEPPLVLINPNVIAMSGKKDTKYESCMSVPGVKGQVTRREKVVVEYQAVDGSAHRLEATGFLARVICHEVDHLDGVLYVDRMEGGSAVEPTDLFERDRQ